MDLSRRGVCSGAPWRRYYTQCVNFTLPESCHEMRVLRDSMVVLDMAVYSKSLPMAHLSILTFLTHEIFLIYHRVFATGALLGIRQSSQGNVVIVMLIELSRQDFKLPAAGREGRSLKESVTEMLPRLAEHLNRLHRPDLLRTVNLFYLLASHRQCCDTAVLLLLLSHSISPPPTTDDKPHTSTNDTKSIHRKSSACRLSQSSHLPSNTHPPCIDRYNKNLRPQ